MRHGLRVIAAGCFSCSCRCARAFLSPTPSHHHSTAATKGRPSTSTAPPPALGVQLPLKNLGIPAALWAGQQVQGNSEAGESGGAMPPTGDERHHPSALRNRGFIAAELVKWLGGQDSGSSSPSAASSSEAPGLLEIASGTGCHAEAFAKALPAWSFQPTEVISSDTMIHNTVLDGCPSLRWTAVVPRSPLVSEITSSSALSYTFSSGSRDTYTCCIHDIHRESPPPSHYMALR